MKVDQIKFAVKVYNNYYPSSKSPNSSDHEPYELAFGDNGFKENRKTNMKVFWHIFELVCEGVITKEYLSNFEKDCLDYIFKENSTGLSWADTIKWCKEKDILYEIKGYWESGEGYMDDMHCEAICANIAGKPMYIKHRNVDQLKYPVGKFNDACNKLNDNIIKHHNRKYNRVGEYPALLLEIINGRDLLIENGFHVIEHDITYGTNELPYDVIMSIDEYFKNPMIPDKSKSINMPFFEHKDECFNVI